MHAARCNPLEKQQHLITVSSELQRAQHACEPCPDAPGPSLHLHLSSASSRAVCSLQVDGAIAGTRRRSSSRSPCDFPSRHPAAELCSSPPAPAPALHPPALHQADPLSTHASRPRAETYAAPFRPPTTGALHSALHVLRLSPSCLLICSRDASPCRKLVASC